MWENPESNVTAFSSKHKTVLLLVTRSSIHAGNIKASEVFRREQSSWCSQRSRWVYASDISSACDRCLLLQHIRGETPAFPPRDRSNQTQRAGRKSEESCCIFPSMEATADQRCLQNGPSPARCSLHTSATPRQRVLKQPASLRSSDD